MNLTRMQLAAVLRAGIIVSKADGTADPKELELLVHELKKFDLSPEAGKNIIDVANDMPVETMVEQLKQLSYEDQKYVCGYLAVMILADGDIKDSEIEAWKAICTLCDFPTMTAKEALEYWRKH